MTVASNSNMLPNYFVQPFDLKKTEIVTDPVGATEGNGCGYSYCVLTWISGASSADGDQLGVENN